MKQKKRTYLGVLDLLIVIHHIGTQNDEDDDFPCFSPLAIVEILENVRLRVAQYLVQHDAVHVFQWRFVIVAQSQLVLRLHQEGVVLADVPNVVGQRADQKREHLQRGEDRR